MSSSRRALLVVTAVLAAAPSASAVGDGDAYADLDPAIRTALIARLPDGARSGLPAPTGDEYSGLDPAIRTALVARTGDDLNGARRPATTLPPPSTAAAGSFDWADAGIGAATATGTLVLAFGAALSLRRRLPSARSA